MREMPMTLVLLMALAAVLLLAVPADAAEKPYDGPAFLDAFDTVTVWLPEPATPHELEGKVRVTVDGKDVPVASITGGERAGGPRDPEMVVLAGTLQPALGGSEWDPGSAQTRMQKISDGVYELVVPLEAGRYEYKVARGGSWDENYGRGFERSGPNIALDVPSKQVVRFVVDFSRHSIKDSVNNAGEVWAPAAHMNPSPVSDQDITRFQSVRLKLEAPLTPEDVCKPIILVSGNVRRTVYAREVLSDPAFFYPKDDLGARWSKDSTTFKVWSPVSSEATLLLYKAPKGGEARRVPMRRGAAGVWYARLPGDLHGTFYQYEFRSYGKTRVAADIYARAASADSARAMVVDLSRTNPPGWPGPRPFDGKKPTDAILYEAHIRDLSSHPGSGVSEARRGKYLGIAETGTRVPGTDFPTTLDYLKDLGITHLHLLPIQDFNPAHQTGYNWGYETTLFNVPEEQYSVPFDDPLATIREVKQMILALHKAGIGLVLDVVYNHTVPSEGEWSAFHQTVPYYWFRTNDRGDNLNESGVGNALNDERPMVRKYVEDSLRYWTREYRVDGFRFDLLGMFTPETVRALVKAIRDEYPYAVVYGEPWTGGGPVRFGRGAQRGTGVAIFNDQFRGAFRGDTDGAVPGFAMGAPADRGFLQSVIAASLDIFTDSPEETVNYVSAHDNLTLWDKVTNSMPGADRDTKASAVKLATAAVLLSQGIPFIEGGIEIGRTKGMDHNSYDAGDEFNQFHWERAREFVDVRDYVRGLIALRKAHPAFRLSTKEQVKSLLTFLPSPDGTVAFRLDGAKAGDAWKDIVVIFNGSRGPAAFELPEGGWRLAVDGRRAGTASLGEVAGKLTLEPLSAAVVYR